MTTSRSQERPVGTPENSEHKEAEQGTPNSEVTPSTPTPTPEPVGPAGNEPSDGLPSDVGELKNMISELRHENAKTRVNAKQAAAQEARNELVGQIAEALGIGGEKPPTPQQLQEAVTVARQEAQENKRMFEAAQTRLEVFQAAHQVGADPDMLLDSTRFMTHLQENSGSGDVPTLIETWVKENPRFGATQVVGPSTIEHPSGTGETGVTKKELAAMTLQEKVAFARANPEEFKRLTA